MSVPELQSGCQLKDTDIVKYLKQGSRDDLADSEKSEVAEEEEEEDSGTDIELEVTEDPERKANIMDSVRIQAAKPPRSKSRSPMKRIKKFFKGSSSSKDQDKTSKYLQGVDTSRYYQVLQYF